MDPIVTRESRRLGPADLTLCALEAVTHTELDPDSRLLFNGSELSARAAVEELARFTKPVACGARNVERTISITCSPLETTTLLADWEDWVESSVKDEVKFLRGLYGADREVVFLVDRGGMTTLDDYERWKRDYYVFGAAFSIRDDDPRLSSAKADALLSFGATADADMTVISVTEDLNKPNE